MATPTLATELSLALSWNYASAADLSTARDRKTFTTSDTLATGTGANQSDLIFHDTRTATAAPDDLDLAGGLTDPLGNTLTFAEITGIFIHNKSETATEVLSIGADANGLVNWVGAVNDIVKIGPEGILFVWNPRDGYAVTADTGDILQVDPGADTIEYDVVIIGRSA